MLITTLQKQNIKHAHVLQIYLVQNHIYCGKKSHILGVSWFSSYESYKPQYYILGGSVAAHTFLLFHVRYLCVYEYARHLERIILVWNEVPQGSG